MKPEALVSRNLRDRPLNRELLTNVAPIRVETRAAAPMRSSDGSRRTAGFAILIEMMRREGHEMSVSKPKLSPASVASFCRPVEILIIGDCPEANLGTIMEKWALAK
jgi:predicted membrane GTPase involved in stress response